MPEVWLRTNRRAILWAMLPAGAVAIAGALVLAGSSGREALVARTGLLLLGLVLIGLGGSALAYLIRELRRPRLAYADGELLLFLRRGKPIRVPVGAVECFLLGQGASRLPWRRLKTATVLIRLCPQLAEWRHGQVDPRLGEWRDSHFIICGTWCEPLSVDVVRRLNVQLGRAVRQGRGGDAA